VNYWLEAFRNESTQEGKFQIIWTVAKFETHNSVSKQTLLEMLRYMVDFMLEEEPLDGGAKV